MKKLIDLLFSVSTAGFLLLVFALALAIATFVENSYGSEAARAIVYNSWWLEVILLILAINLVANVLKYKLYRKQKLTLGIFHLALILILLGAGVTRYFGYEGMMHIREGESSSTMVSQEIWFHVTAENEGVTQSAQKRFYESSASKDQISENLTIGNKKLSIKSVVYIMQAQKGLATGTNGKPVIEIVYPEGGAMKSEFLESGKLINVNGASLGFGVEAQVQFSNSSDTLKMVSRDTVTSIDMAGKTGLTFTPGKSYVCIEKTIYKVKNAMFVFKQFLPSAVLEAVPAKGMQTGTGALKIQLSDNQKQEDVTVWTVPENRGPKFEGSFDGMKIAMWVGPREMALPFSIALKDFVLERYPGSNSPSSYESTVTLTDKEQNVTKDFRIFMNNVLKHRGYRFYQSAYDPDEKGTILSVNNDPWGTAITYIGYFLLFLGIILSIFNPSSFFFKLMKKISAGTSAVIVLILLSSFKTDAAVPTEIPADVANSFSKVWVQGHDGRIKPFTTLAYESFKS